MATHVKVIAALFLVFGALFLAGAVFTPLFLGMIAGLVGAFSEEDAAVGAVALGFTGIALSVVFALFAVPFVATGWGLLKLRPWARIAGIILAAICLTKIPFGTVFGIYALVILFKKETEALFTGSAGSTGS